MSAPRGAWSDGPPSPSPSTSDPQPTATHPIDVFCAAQSLSPAATRILKHQFRRTPMAMLPQLTRLDLTERMADAKSMLESEKHAPRDESQPRDQALAGEENPFDAELSQLLARHLQPKGTLVMAAASPAVVESASLSPSPSSPPVDKSDAAELAPAAAAVGPLSRFAAVRAVLRAPWFHLCRASLVVSLYYTSLSLDLIAVIPIYQGFWTRTYVDPTYMDGSADPRTYDVAWLSAACDDGGCTWNCETWALFNVNRYGSEACEDVCPLALQGRRYGKGFTINPLSSWDPDASAMSAPTGYDGRWQQNFTSVAQYCSAASECCMIRA